MKSARKSLRPANDTQPHALQRVGSVALPRPYWDVRRVASLCMLAMFILILGFGLVAAFMPHASSIQNTALPTRIVKKTVSPKNVPYDITLDADSLVPPDEATRLATALPPHVTITKHTARHSPDNTAHRSTGVMTVTVQNENSLHQTPHARALMLASLAHDAIEQGDLAQAIRFQHRAVSAEPENIGAVLALAVMLDHAGNLQSAAAHYQQVVDAFDSHNPTVPATIKIYDIRRRVDYLKQSFTASE